MPSYKIIMTTDRQHIGKTVHETDGMYTMPTGETFEETGFEELPDGSVKIWNSNYVIHAQEIAG